MGTFDANKGTTFSFKISGDSLNSNGSYKFCIEEYFDDLTLSSDRVFIPMNPTASDKVYDLVIPSNKLHNLGDNTAVDNAVRFYSELHIGIVYYCENDEIVEACSYSCLFRCIPTPIITFNNLSTDSTTEINKSYVEFKPKIESTKDLLGSYCVDIFSDNESNSEKVFSTERIYINRDEIFDSEGFTVNGLFNGKYKLWFYGTTCKGLNFSKSYSFNITYGLGENGFAVEAINDHLNGRISITNYFVSLFGKADSAGAVYLLDGEGLPKGISLQDKGKLVGFEDLNINGDFILSVDLSSVKNSIKTIRFLSNGSSVYIQPHYNAGSSTVSFSLHCKNRLFDYSVASNMLSEISDTTRIVLWVKKKNGLYKIKLFKKEEGAV